MEHRPPKKKQKTRTSSQVNVVKLGTRPPDSSARFDPFTAFKTPGLSWNYTDLSSTERKGKEKANSKSSNFNSRNAEKEHADMMWADMYEPTTEAELAVHKKKIEEVRHWLSEAFYGGPSGALMKYRRLLILTGPAGAGKTATLRVLAKEMDFRIMEWRNTLGENSRNTHDEFNGLNENSDSYSTGSYNAESETPFSKFEAFLSRASSCQDLFTTVSKNIIPLQKSSRTDMNRHIILLEELPNVSHPGTQTQFHAALQALVASPISKPPIPVVIVISDAGVRGEASDEQTASGRGWERRTDGIVDIRTVLPKPLLGSAYVTQIGFNPIAPTLLLKALQALLHSQFPTTSEAPLSREILETVVQSANGDIRSAIMTAQFACVPGMNGKFRRNKGGKSLVLESVTRREQSLVLFHLLGKILYNKRKGDPPSSSASAKDIQKEKLLEAHIRDPPKLPPGLQEHERRASRIDVDTLCADSPIDSSLLSLYIHQNYTQFCDGIEHCEGIADWLSWVDSSGGDAWHQANPHRFHLLALGTLHCLPSPVTRQSQKIHKPAFFENLDKEKKARESVRDVYGWLSHGSDVHNSWSLAEVALEMGSVLKARDAVEDALVPRPPPSHRLFSNLVFTPAVLYGAAQTLDEKEAVSSFRDPQDDIVTPIIRKDIENEGGWLENDDIEEF